jgi:hypothetical protein
MIKNVLYSLLLIAIMTGCSSGGASVREAQLGNLVIEDSFDAVGNWDTQDTDNLYLNVENGVYRAVINWRDRYLWGMNDVVHTDAVLEVDVQFDESDRLTQGGIICRASPQNTGDGYYFLISADGKYSMRAGVSSGSRDMLVQSQTHEAIQTGGQVNRIRAVCIGNRLQFFVNDEFIVAVKDERHVRGYTGLVIGMLPNASGEGHGSFDNLRVWEASMP